MERSALGCGCVVGVTLANRYPEAFAPAVSTILVIAAAVLPVPTTTIPPALPSPATPSTRAAVVPTVKL